MIRTTCTAARAVALAVVLASSSCSFLSPAEDTTRFAVLATVDDLPGAPPSGTAAQGLKLGIGPIDLPEYLHRMEVQTRTDGTRLIPSATERWGEPLDRGVERVLMVDLSRALGASQVVLHPWYATERPDVQVRIAFTRFEREAPGQVVLRARWSIRRLGTDAPAVERETDLKRQVSGTDGASTALALSQALVDLSSEIAAAWPGTDAAAGP
jgi:uncharacterized lipoprotein YmbA